MTHGRMLLLPSEFHLDLVLACNLMEGRGILVPGGFGQRGTEGMILAIKRAREYNIPFLGICLGFQTAVIEWARNVCALTGESAPPPPRWS